MLDGGGPMGVDGEVHAAGDGSGPIDLIEAGPDLEAGNLVQGDQVDPAGQRQLDRLLRLGLRGQAGVLCHSGIPPSKKWYVLIIRYFFRSVISFSGSMVFFLLFVLAPRDKICYNPISIHILGQSWRPSAATMM